MNASRNDCISGYIPGFGDSSTSGVKSYLGQLKAQTLSGTTSTTAGVTTSVAHKLGAVPAFILISPIMSAGAVTAKHTVSQATASAATSSVFYVVGSKASLKFRAFLMLA